MRRITKWNTPVPAPHIRYACVRRWRRLAVTKGGLAVVGGLVPVSFIALLIALRLDLPPHLQFLAFAPLAFLLQLVAHEAGHALVAVARGYRVQTVMVTAPAVGVVSERPSKDFDL